MTTTTPPSPSSAPPSSRTDPITWARRHVFRSPGDTVVTLTTLVLAGWILFRTVRFLLVTGRWEIVRTNLGLYLYGRYPTDELWRVVVVVLASAVTAGLLAGVIAQRSALVEDPHAPDAGPLRRAGDVAVRLWPLVLLVVLCLALARTTTPILVALGTVAAAVAGRLLGGVLPRPLHRVAFAVPVVLPFVVVPLLAGPQGWDEWGGLMLTLFLAAVSMLACFPLGLVLALGRRSTLPAVRAVCVGIIEFFRGVPLVVLVLMSDVALGFFFPQSLLPGKVVRVIVAFTIFTAAYVAEIVRGGLQSVPRGQTEAAQAVGLSPVRVMGWIVLPQALRNVIPALVGQFISLFKDTTLVFIIGFLDVLSVADAVTKQRQFELNMFPEAALFAALLFWVGSYTLSRESQRLERRLGVGSR